MAKKPNITPATADEVPVLTDRLAEVERLITELDSEKKTIRARLEAYALLQRGEPLADSSREGRKVTLVGSRWSLPVVFTSDLLIGSFKHESPKHQELRTVLLGKPAETKEEEASADLQLKLFFEPPNTWESKFDCGQKFRAASAEWLHPDVAPKFITACTSRDKHGVKKFNTTFDVKSMKPLTADGKEEA